ncbi:unnamed protein product, partial [Mesorhabditis spiculigera]
MYNPSMVRYDDWVAAKLKLANRTTAALSFGGLLLYSVTWLLLAPFIYVLFEDEPDIEATQRTQDNTQGDSSKSGSRKVAKPEPARKKNTETLKENKTQTEKERTKASNTTKTGAAAADADKSRSSGGSESQETKEKRRYNVKIISDKSAVQEKGAAGAMDTDEKRKEMADLLQKPRISNEKPKRSEDE